MTAGYLHIRLPEEYKTLLDELVEYTGMRKTDLIHGLLDYAATRTEKKTVKPVPKSFASTVAKETA